MKPSYELRLLLVFIALFIIYLAVAGAVLYPAGYYGTAGEPSYADPWIARAETIVSGGSLYQDVWTTTPPLVNFLLVPPVVMSRLSRHTNPWSTLSFMTYFSIFNLLAAYVLLNTGGSRKEGYLSGLYFLANPLTFGNSVLRRQDESILVFFLSLGLLFLLHHRRWRASIAIGLAMLIKLSGALMMPVAFFHRREWKYLIIPVAIFGLAFAPFLWSAGESAVFWDISGDNTQHPFQLHGISFGNLWRHGHNEVPLISLRAHSIILVVGSALALALIAWSPLGVLEDLSLLIITGLFLSPKLHAGYFALVVLVMAPLVRRSRIGWLYFPSGVLIMLVDMFKSELDAYNVAFGLLAAAFLLLIAAVVRFRCADQAGIVESD
ncbi:MAG: glycosyltransferase 87 family protein [Anaerolineae bacterium]